MPSVAVVALSSDSIRARAQCRPTRSNNILYARPRLVQLSFHFPIAQILIEPITRRASSVAPCSHFCSNRQCSTDVQDFGFAYLPLEGQVLHRMRRLHSERRLGRISYPHASHKLPRRSSPAQANFRSSFHSYRGPTCVDDVPVSDDRLLVRGPETRICSIRGWKTGVGVARSTVDMHRVRVRNRASVERPSPGVPTVRPPICACVSTRQAIRRRDRTRQPVTTPQLVTPLESVKQ
ncbi:hypothetical protein EVAR_74668_1 [Eumeta japonica]|uniref:Uncharacterized protein n=1 Tax=Eumeta variegata TaxID=151549 RepID=A0A4C1TJR7_EUMVA|nr:hypothetical protein EVAR_74668_1 [Eumeta japonica]